MADCVRCEKPMPDTAFACSGCMDRARRQLLGDDRRDDRPGLVHTAPAARDIANGLSRSQSAVGGCGVPGSRVPLDLSARSRLDAAGNALGGWVRIVSDDRGVYPERVPAGFDTIAPAARFLAAHLEYARHQSWADEFLRDVEACARVVRGIARGPAEQKFLGPCGATVTWDADGAEIPRETPCEGDVYAQPGAEDGACRSCKARWAVKARSEWLDEQVRDKAFRATHIADAYGINVNTIRTWARDQPEERAPNGTIIRKARAAKLRTHGRDLLGRPLYLVGEVLDLAAKAAARRAESEARGNAMAT